MIEYLKNLKLNKWYGMVLYLGIGAIILSMYFQVDFIEDRYLFGLGLGLIFIGVSFFIAEKTLSTIKPPNAYTGGPILISQTKIHHNPITVIILIIGLLFICLFGFLITRNLI